MFDTKILGTDEDSIAYAAKLLSQGEVVGMPTETVYGLAANAFDEAAVRKIFAAKGRPADNPLIVHISDISQLEGLVDRIPPLAVKCAEKFWAGPLTMIMPKSEKIPMVTSGGLDTVGIRMPSHKVARALISACGFPIAAPSANLSGSPSPTTAQHVLNDMHGRIPAIIDGGACGVGVESTVISFEGEDGIRLLRPGFISAEDLMEITPNVLIDKGVLEKLGENVKVRSPGMKYKHYAPKADVTIIDSNLEAFRDYVKAHGDKDTTLMVFTDNDCDGLDIPHICYGANDEEQAKELFDVLRELDDIGAKKVYARCPKSRRFSGGETVKKTVVGLTGQSGAGKTTISDAFRENGFEIINCDIVAREVTKAGSECCKKLAKIFPDCFDDGFALDRRKLGEIVFSDKARLQMLNDTIYPFINKLIDEKINATESEFVLLDAPTLFEAGADKLCSVIVSVVADFGIRLERITKRDGISAELAKKRFSSQHTMEFFKAHSDFVIENNGSVNDTFQKTCEVIETIKERYNGG